VISLKINFWSGSSLPMYGKSVEELHLEIRTADQAPGYGERYVVKSVAGRPELVKADPAQLKPSKPSVVERLKADLAYHQEQVEKLGVELDVDSDVAYSIETDTAESYHTGRVEALTNAIDLIIGRDVTLYSETQREHA
jgi:hypothetical protein